MVAMRERERERERALGITGQNQTLLDVYVSRLLVIFKNHKRMTRLWKESSSKLMFLNYSLCSK